MLRSSFFNDPFFGGADEQMRQMDSMFNDSFGMLGGGHRNRNQLALQDGRRQQQHAQNMQVAGRDMFMDPFAHFNSMFSNMHSMMADMHRTFDGSQAIGNGQVYSHSSFTSFSKGANGESPKYYQASSSTHQGPGGIRETRKTLRDSERGIDKMAVGHHINDRGHVIERTRNKRSGDTHENQEFINLDEEEASCFDQEYQEKRNSLMRGIDHRRHHERSRHAPVAGNRRHHAALPGPESNRPHRSHNRRE